MARSAGTKAVGHTLTMMPDCFTFLQMPHVMTCLLTFCRRMNCNCVTSGEMAKWSAEPFLRLTNTKDGTPVLAFPGKKQAMDLTTAVWQARQRLLRRLLHDGTQVWSYELASWFTYAFAVVCVCANGHHSCMLLPCVQVCLLQHVGD